MGCKVSWSLPLSSLEHCDSRSFRLVCLYLSCKGPPNPLCVLNKPVLKQLKELTRLTQTNGVLNELTDPSDKTVIGRLYRALLADPHASEEEIVVAVYGPGAETNLPAFQKLKTRLRNLLIDALVSVSVMYKPDYSTYVSTYQTLQRQYASAQLLLSMRAYHNCANVLERVYRTASKYDIVELQYQASQRLMGLYMGLVHNPNKFEFYSKRSVAHRDAFTELGKVVTALYTFKHHLHNRLGDAVAIARVAIEQAEIVHEVLLKNPELSVAQLTYYDLQSQVCFLQGNFSEAVKYAEAGENYYLASPTGIPTRLYVFRIMQFRALGFLNQLDKGEVVAQRIERNVKKGSVNWLDLQEVKIYFYLKLKLYDKAYIVASAVDQHKLQKMLSGELRQVWEIISALMHLLVVCGQVTIKEKPGVFRISRFLNSVPTYSKEKSRMNVQILVIHTILLIVSKQYDKAIDRVEALEKYCSRYLSKNDNLRSNCFIKMLTAVVKGNFHFQAAQRYAEKYRLKLVAAEPNLLNQIDRVEIIPYEDLWGILLAHLGNKIISRR